MVDRTLSWRIDAPRFTVSYKRQEQNNPHSEIDAIGSIFSHVVCAIGISCSQADCDLGISWSQAVCDLGISWSQAVCALGMTC